VLSIPGSKLCQRRQRELPLQERDPLALGYVTGEPAQGGTVVLDRILLRVEEQEPQSLLQRQMPDLPCGRLGDDQIAALDRSAEDRPRMPCAVNGPLRWGRTALRR
jgi:hypothetical protein